jgi:alcohol dehydrogenase (cytochrome c)
MKIQNVLRLVGGQGMAFAGVAVLFIGTSAMAAYAEPAFGPVDAELLDPIAGEWPHFNRTYSGDRFSPLHQIDVGNAARLTPRCVLQLGEVGSFETSPLVYRDRMYLTTPHKTIAADAHTCAVIWSQTYTPVGPEHIPSNRGSAIYRGKLYRGTTDGHLLALDMNTGTLIWDVQVADALGGYFVSAAPMAFDGKILVGEGGGDHGIKGHIHAYDAQTGREVWKFDVIPTGTEPGADSWAGGQETGGGSSWSSMAVDPARHLLFVPTGNPGPDFNASQRQGADLYTDSVVVLNADSGGLEWYEQQVPGDIHDWDTAAAPALYELQGRSYMAVASKDGFLYVYDRQSHAKAFQTPTMTRVNVDTPFNTSSAVRYCPGGLGQWNGPAYSPLTQMLYVGSADRCDTIQLAQPKYVRGQLFFGGLLKPGQDENPTGTVRGINAATGKQVWAYQSPSVIVAGVTPTAGGLLLTGDATGNFLVFNAASGKVLYRFTTGGGIAGGISTYEVGGEQLIAVPSGNSSRGTWNTTGSATVIVFGLGDK